MRLIKGRLIDADALIESLDEFPFVQTAMMMHVNSQPTIDAVPVVRCKDCIHNVSNRITDPLCINDYSGDDIVCDYFETDGMEPDDYCSYAERNSE